LRKIHYIFLVVILAACVGQKEEVVDISEITPQSKRNYDNDTTPESTKDSITLIKKRFIEYGIGVDMLVYSEKRLFPDRVGPIRHEKFDLQDGEFDFQYFNWTYSDSSKVMNSFYNWLDVLGVEQIGSKVNIQDEFMCVLVGDTNLIYVNGSNGSTGNEWLAYHDSLGYDENWNYMIEQYHGKRASWYQFDEGKRKELKIE